MTQTEAITYIQAQVADIEALSGDNEVAHVTEDCLYLFVLWHIKNNAPAPWCDLASEALRAQAVHFDRWYS